MHIPAPDCFHLLHRCATLALASHSHTLPGFPFVTALPFAPGPDHAPWLLMSELAEHCRNVRLDGRVSVLLQAGQGSVLEGERMTVVGELHTSEPDAITLARLLRYQPEFADYLELGDFHFFRLQPLRIRFIGGFGRMGWVEGEQWQAEPAVDGRLEQQVLAALQQQHPEQQWLGVDHYGIDLRSDGQRQRLVFDTPTSADTLLDTALAAAKA